MIWLWIIENQMWYLSVLPIFPGENENPAAYIVLVYSVYGVCQFRWHRESNQFRKTQRGIWRYISYDVQIYHIIFSRYHLHEIIFSLHVSEMLNCISSSLNDSEAILLPRLYLQANASFEVEYRAFSDSRKMSYSEILDCVPDDRVLTSLKSGKISYS